MLWLDLRNHSPFKTWELDLEIKIYQNFAKGELQQWLLDLSGPLFL